MGGKGGLESGIKKNVGGVDPVRSTGELPPQIPAISSSSGSERGRHRACCPQFASGQRGPYGSADRDRIVPLDRRRQATSHKVYHHF